MYTVIIKDEDDYMEVKRIPSDYELSALISEIVDDRRLDPHDKYLREQLAEYVIIFEGTPIEKFVDIIQTKVNVKLTDVITTSSRKEA